MPATWSVNAGHGQGTYPSPRHTATLQELIHIPKMGTESRCLLSPAAWPKCCHQDTAAGGQGVKEGPSFISRGGPESRAECLILTCLNQQVLTEDGGRAEYKEPAFPNRNLLKVASDLKGVCQSEKSKAE